MTSPSPYGGYSDPTARATDGPDSPDTASPAARVLTERLWATGAATAVVAALAAVVATLLVRGVLDVPVFAPEREGAIGNATTGWLAVGAAAAALLATGLLHLLLVATAQPRRLFAWIVTLATAAMALLPFTTDASASAKVGTAAVYVVIGVAIGTLLSATARSVLPRPPVR